MLHEIIKNYEEEGYKTIGYLILESGSFESVLLVVDTDNDLNRYNLIYHASNVYYSSSESIFPLNRHLARLLAKWMNSQNEN